MSYLFTDEEKRLLFSALRREEEFCRAAGYDYNALILPAIKAKLANDKGERKLIELAKGGLIK